eukprot:4306716-Pyramimonas_sp.AAC.1
MYGGCDQMYATCDQTQGAEHAGPELPRPAGGRAAPRGADGAGGGGHQRPKGPHPHVPRRAAAEAQNGMVRADKYTNSPQKVG